MAGQKMLERSTGTAFLLLALYLIISFTNVLSTLGAGRLFESNPITLSIFILQVLAGIAFLIAGILFWLDSRNNEETTKKQ